MLRDLARAPTRVARSKSTSSKGGRRLLPDNAVHVWVLDQSLMKPTCAALFHILSTDEQQRAQAYRRDHDFDRFVTRRIMLRWLIGSYLDCEPQSLCFCANDYGKPTLRLPEAPRLAFNVSQTEGMAVLAFAQDCHIGVDVERPIAGLDLRGIAREIFSWKEEDTLRAVPPDAVEETFFRTWVRKEALLKARGTGLSFEPKSCTTASDPRVDGCWCVSQNGTVMTGWTFLDLPVGPNVLGALAVSLANAQVSLRTCIFD